MTEDGRLTTDTGGTVSAWFLAHMKLRLTAVALFALELTAHEGEDHSATGWVEWFPEMLVVALLAASIILYLAGAIPMVRRGSIRRWHVLSFVGGWVVLVIALASPIDDLSDVLFSVHMTQHELLMLIAAPLIVMGRPLTPFLRALPKGMKKGFTRLSSVSGSRVVWRFLTNPVNVWVVNVVVLLGWHLPVFYEAALRSELVHFVQHAMFLGAAVLFWWAITHGRYGRFGYGMATVYVFATALVSGALGALITVAPRLIYPIYEGRTIAMGADPLRDQQLAGLIMWIPAGVILLILALSFMAAWLGALESRAPSRPGVDR